MKIVGISGSLRDGSHTRNALDIALEKTKTEGAETELIDLEEINMDVFNPDEDRNPEVEEAAKSLQEADGIILATPMYHGSYSSPIKTFIDHMGFDEFRDKTVGLLGVSGGSFPITALEHLRTVCKSLDAWVLPHEAAIPEAGDAFEDGLDDDLRRRIDELGEKMVRFAGIEGSADTFESQQNTGAVDR